MPDLELIPTEELLGELGKRYDSIVFAGLKWISGERKQFLQKLTHSGGNFDALTLSVILHESLLRDYRKHLSLTTEG